MHDATPRSPSRRRSWPCGGHEPGDARRGRVERPFAIRGMNARCPICAARGAGRIHRGSAWSVRAHPDPSPLAGWVILDLDRHAEGWDDLTDAEAAEFGAMVRRSVGAVRGATGCDRVYLLSFCEAVPHLHLHLAPRRIDDDRSRAWDLADLYRAVGRGEAAPADAERCRQTAARIASLLRDGA